jgi:hypothetical protein
MIKGCPLAGTWGTCLPVIDGLVHRDDYSCFVVVPSMAGFAAATVRGSDLRLGCVTVHDVTTLAVCLSRPTTGQNIQSVGETGSPSGGTVHVSQPADLPSTPMSLDTGDVA